MQNSHTFQQVPTSLNRTERVLLFSLPNSQRGLQESVVAGDLQVCAVLKTAEYYRASNWFEKCHHNYSLRRALHMNCVYQRAMPGEETEYQKQTRTIAVILYTVQ